MSAIEPDVFLKAANLLKLTHSLQVKLNILPVAKIVHDIKYM